MHGRSCSLSGKSTHIIRSSLGRMRASPPMRLGFLPYNCCLARQPARRTMSEQTREPTRLQQLSALKLPKSKGHQHNNTLLSTPATRAYLAQGMLGSMYAQGSRVYAQGRRFSRRVVKEETM